MQGSDRAPARQAAGRPPAGGPGYAYHRPARTDDGMPTSAHSASDSPVGRTMRSLALDLVGVTVIRALELNGVSTILLKGPVVAKRLYGSADRTYVDIDLLVEPRSVAVAEATLGEHGFTHLPLDEIPGDRPWHARYWHRATDNAGIDLHRTLIGVRKPPADCWNVLRSRTAHMRLAGATVSTLDDAGIALHAALHAAQDGARLAKPLRDLDRALERLSEEAWSQAGAMARELDAEAAFAAGLALRPAGVALASRLRIPPTHDLETLLRAQGGSDRALGLEWLIRQHGLRPKMRLVAAKLFPSPDFMRAWAPSLCGLGRPGLAVAYAWRVIWLATLLPPAYVRRRRARGGRL